MAPIDQDWERSRKVEYRLVEGLNSLPNIRAWHSSRQEDQEEGWDVAVELCGLVTVKVDATISKGRYLWKKQHSAEKQARGIVPVRLNPRDTPRQMAMRALQRIVATLPRESLAELFLSLLC